MHNRGVNLHTRVRLFELNVLTSELPRASPF